MSKNIKIPSEIYNLITEKRQTIVMNESEKNKILLC